MKNCYHGLEKCFADFWVIIGLPQLGYLLGHFYPNYVWWVNASVRPIQELFQAN